MIDTYQISLKAFLKNAKGETLLLRTHPNSNFGRQGFYDLPGGRIDVEEFTTDFEDIMGREIREELGDIQIQITTQPTGFARRTVMGGEHVGKHVLYIFFNVDFLGGDIRISNEHVGYEWIDVESIAVEKYFTPEFLPAVRAYLNK